jgi:DNA processing protein
MYPDIIYQIALTRIPQIGPVQARLLLSRLSLREIFTAGEYFLEKIEGIGPIRAASIRQFKQFACIEKELRFIERHNIRALFFTDKDYPQRLLHCYDAPLLLYYKGDADLNCHRSLSIVGSRRVTDYGQQVTKELIRDLAAQRTLIVSGLAYGIDALAHKEAMEQGLPTVGVLAHGLDRIYPGVHAGLARDMLRNGGGLLTEFTSNTLPDRYNFPQRNRVVAGLTDATIVIETALRGGSMITANLAWDYHREIFAVPGRLTDKRSAGCNELIRSNKAHLYTDAASLCEAIGWHDPKEKRSPAPDLFPDAGPEETAVINLLREKPLLQVDQISFMTGMDFSRVASAILTLELQNRVVSLPGKRYRLS